MNVKPDWDAIASSVTDNLSKEELNAVWATECQKWLKAINEEYGEGYHIHESSNFFLLANESDRYVRVFSDFMELTLKRILKTLDGIASDDGYGKHATIIFADDEQYYKYVGLFYPEEGDFGLSSGMYINEGYGHFVFPSQDITYAEPIAVHELTHACLAHLPLPTWLNEGLAVSMEDVLAGNHLYLDKKIVAKHAKYWDETTIQKFWSGGSFFSSDEGQDLSYNLAHILVRNLSEDYESFRRFVVKADYSDGGNAACLEHFGCSLSSVAADFLGEGNWQPTEEFSKAAK